MQSVPKIVLRRLQSPAGQMHPDADHPDADLLTAFAEQLLPESERALVIGHLANCGECREIVTLALPATEAAVTATSPIRIGWLSLPVLRWGVVAAGILALTSVGVLQYKQHRPPDRKLASLQISDQAISAAQSPHGVAHEAPAREIPRPRTEMTMAQLETRPTPHVPSEPALPKTRKRAPARLDAGSAQSLAADGGITAGSNSRDSRATVSSTPSGSSADAAKPAPAPPVVPRASETVEVQAEAGPVNVETATAQASNQIATQSQNDLPLQGRNFTQLDVVKAKNPVPAQRSAASASAAPAPPGRALQAQPSLMQRAMPLWTISSTGALRRSLDAGKTWEDVNPNQASAGSDGAITTSNQMMANQKKEQSGSAAAAPETSGAGSAPGAKENRPATPQPVIFHDVAAIGSEVWAGAASAMLYHSVDAGAHWTRVLPAASGILLTGDISSIQFSDLEHGKVATSTGELWLTSDNGHTWQKQ